MTLTSKITGPRPHGQERKSTSFQIKYFSRWKTLPDSHRSPVNPERQMHV